MKALPTVLSLCLLLAPVSPVTAAPANGEAQALLHQGRELAAAMSYDQALERLYRARQMAVVARDPSTEAEVLLQIGATLGNSGAPDRSLAPILEAVRLLEAHGEPAALANALRRSGEARNASDDVRGSDRDLARAAEIYRRIGDLEGAARIDASRSVILSLRGAYARSIEAGEAALEVLRGEAAIRALVGTSYSRHQLGQHRQALADYQRLIELAWRIDDQRTLSFAFCNRADVEWSLGHARPAVDDLWQAVRGFERGRSSISGRTEERQAFIEREINAYDRLVRFLVDTGDRRAAFEVAERLHGRSLIERLGESPKALGEAQEQRLIADIGRTRLGLEEAPDEAARGRVKGQLGTLERQLRDIQRKRALGTASGELEHGDPVTVEAVQAGLAAGEVLISYWLTRDRVLTWVVTSGAFRFLQMPIGQHQLESQIVRYLEPLRSRSRSVSASLLAEEDEHREVGGTLYDWLIAPVAEVVAEVAPRATDWILVPDGSLHYLPFEALIRECREPELDALHGAYASCSYLGLEKSLSYTSSAGALLAVRARRAARAPISAGPLLAMAPAFSGPLREAAERANRGPLHWNDDEVRRIGRWFTDAEVVIGDDASEARFKDELTRHRRLHLATHGLVDDAVPQGSGLLLAPAAGEDGLLQTREVLELDLRADLVTLSACRTGRGPLSRGEGLVGLTQAFLDAGASTLVVSLWDVDDRTTPMLMDSFYRHLAGGLRPAEALRQARLELVATLGQERLVFRDQPVSYAHPRYWAGFVVIGANL